MTSAKLKVSRRAQQVIAPLLAHSETPFKDYLKATDYCTAVMNYTDLEGDREYMAQWRAAFTALMVADDVERARLLRRLRADYKNGRSPLTSLMPGRR